MIIFPIFEKIFHRFKTKFFIKLFSIKILRESPTRINSSKRNIDDRKFTKSIGSAVMKLQFDAEKMSIKKRDKHIISNLPEMEKSGSF